MSSRQVLHVAKSHNQPEGDKTMRTNEHLPKDHEASSEEDIEVPETPLRRYGRRGLMLGAAAVGAGITASVVAGGSTAEAANKGDVILGKSNAASSTTSITTSGGSALYGVAEAASGLTGITAGLWGDSESEDGVVGTSTDNCGVYGVAVAASGIGRGQAGVGGDSSTGSGVVGSSASGDGVHGVAAAATGYIGLQSGVSGESSSGVGVWGTSLENIGVYGLAGYSSSGQADLGVLGEDSTEAGAVGVYGVSLSGLGVGVWGDSGGATGIGVQAGSAAGTALQVDGVASFSRSGVATVVGTKTTKASSVQVTGVTLTASSMVLATPQGYMAGVGVAGVVTDVTTGSFTIYLTKAVAVSLAVAWFIIDLPAASSGPIARPKLPQVVRRNEVG
jgi:hypothetical protein